MAAGRVTYSVADTEAEWPSLSRRRERPRVAEPVWDYGGKCALGVRFEAEGKAELERGGTHGFGFSTERLAEP